MSDSILVTENLTKTYGNKRVVKDLSFSVKAGEIFGFLGHNGAGKTTTIAMLTTLISPSGGSAWVGGKNIHSESIGVRTLIGYLPEQVALYGEMSVQENLLYFGRLSGIKNPEQRIDEVLEILSFEKWRHTKAGYLSKGMRQRVGIAQAILHEPPILFLDEPVSGLDPQGTRDMRNILLLMNRKYGTTIFMNTHMLSEVTRICTSIGIIRQGEMVYSGRLDELLKRFSHERSLEEIYISLIGKAEENE
jgi:ABC-2 type transport system ATP-binding protein